jgi:hypothetical protein
MNAPSTILRQSPAYRVLQHRFGCLEIIRASDGASVFFQGGEADEFERELIAACKKDRFDGLCADYNEVMSVAS